jgi:hypothetical protein
MEFVGGPSLFDLISRTRLTLEQADHLARDILRGVSAAHSRGMVHRDLKPANILIAPGAAGPVAKVADFGLAKALERDSLGSGQTRTGETMGTPSYMAPEQVNDSKDVDARADIFALGAILYEMVSGELAFPGSSLLQIFNAIHDGRYRPLKELVPDLPERMASAIDGALTTDRDQRIPDCPTLLAVWEGRSPWEGRSVASAVSGEWSDLLGTSEYTAEQPRALRSGSETFALDEPPASLVNPTAAPASIIDEPTNSPTMAPPPSTLAQGPGAPATRALKAPDGEAGEAPVTEAPRTIAPQEPPEGRPSPKRSPLPMVLGALLLLGLPAGLWLGGVFSPAPTGTTTQPTAGTTPQPAAVATPTERTPKAAEPAPADEAPGEDEAGDEPADGEEAGDEEGADASDDPGDAPETAATAAKERPSEDGAARAAPEVAAAQSDEPEPAEEPTGDTPDEAAGDNGDATASADATADDNASADATAADAADDDAADDDDAPTADGPAAGMARVLVTGDTDAVRFQSAGGLARPGDLPPGDYQILFLKDGGFTDPVGQISLTAGQVRTIHCVVSAMRCRL